MKNPTIAKYLPTRVHTGVLAHLLADLSKENLREIARAYRVKIGITKVDTIANLIANRDKLRGSITLAIEPPAF